MPQMFFERIGRCSVQHESRNQMCVVSQSEVLPTWELFLIANGYAMMQCTLAAGTDPIKEMLAPRLVKIICILQAARDIDIHLAAFREIAPALAQAQQERKLTGVHPA